MRSLTLSLVALVLLLPALAQAQVPSPSPTYTLTLTAPGAFGPLATNGSGTVAVTVAMVLSGVICPQPVVVPITLTATPKSPPPFLTVTLDPSVINISIGQGPHGVGPTPAGGGTGDAQLKAMVGNITANASVPIDIVATAPDPGCQPGGLSATSNTVTVFANMTAPPPPPPPVVEEKKGFLPGPGALVGVLVAMGVAAVYRRKA